MKLLVKLNAILILVLVSGLVFTAYFSYSTIEVNAFEQVKDQTRLTKESAQTIRDYTSKEIALLLDNLKEETDTFHPQVVPVYAVCTSFEILHNKKILENLKKFIYREPSDNPSLFPEDMATW
jgi:hypothetical protein